MILILNLLHIRILRRAADSNDARQNSMVPGDKSRINNKDLLRSCIEWQIDKRTVPSEASRAIRCRNPTAVTVLGCTSSTPVRGPWIFFLGTHA